MMNKKRLAALAMSAVMAAGTVSIPVNASAFSDGTDAVAQEATEVTDFGSDAATQSAEVEVAEDVVEAAEASGVTFVPESDNWDTKTGKVTYEVIADNKKETREGQGTKVTEAATCETNEKYYWELTVVGGVKIQSQETEVPNSALGHNWKEDSVLIQAGSCKEYDFTAGPDAEVNANSCRIEKSGYYCDRCEKWSKDGNEVEEVQPTKTAPKHSLAGTATTGYEVEASGKVSDEDEVYNTILKDGKPVLADPTKDGSYIEYTTQKCEICEKDIRTSEEVKPLYATDAKEGLSVVVADSVKNIKDEIGGKDITTIPKAEELQLKDCTKDASYQVAVYAAGVEIGQIGDAEPLRVYTVTVKAHHVTTNPTLEYVNDADKGLLTSTVKDGKLVVANGTCVKDVEYYEVVKCEACKKEVSKEKKTAPKSTNHNYDTSEGSTYDNIKKAVNAGAEYKGTVDGKYVKLVPETVTCEAAGTATFEFYCKDCGEKAATITGVKVPALGHSKAYKTENVVDATCEKAGSYDLITYCDRCGKELKKIKVTGKTLDHTNGVDGQNTEKAEWFIDFIGTAVGGKYEVGQTIQGNVIGDNVNGTEYLTAIVATNCAMCHNNKQVYNRANTDDVTLTVVSLQDATYATVYDKINETYKKVTTKYGTITVKASYTTDDKETVTSEISLPYRSDINAELDENLWNGLHKDKDGVVRYYINGQFAKDYAGIAVYGDGEFFVANGLICTDANGLNLYDGTWYMLANGQIQRGYNGLALYDGQWFYLANGELNEEVNGLVNYDGGQFLVINGRLGYEVNGLWQNFDGDWYYLANGQVQNQYTGVAQYDGAFFYVVNGVLDSDYNGTVEYDGETFKVVNGMLQ